MGKLMQASNKEELAKALDEYLRLKENNGKEDDEDEEKGKEKEEKPINEEKKCDNKELSSRRTSPRKKKGPEMSSHSKGQSLHEADSAENHNLLENQDSAGSHDLVENQDSVENHDSDPEFPPPVPVLPPVVPATSSNITDASKAYPPTVENDPISGTEEANTCTEATLTD